MEKQPPPSYNISEGLPNPHYMGPNVNMGQYNQPMPQNAAPYPQNAAPYPQNAAPYPQNAAPYPQNAAPYPQNAAPYPQNAAPYPTNMGQTPVYVTPSVRVPGSSIHVVSQPTQVPVFVTSGGMLGPHSSMITCFKCGANISTEVRSEPGAMAYISCGVLFLIGCVFGCCLIPFCMEGCQDVHHTCPQCHAYLGKYSRMR